jgi:hypothetical protein
MAFVDVRVAQSSSDAEERLTDGGMYLVGSDLELTHDPDYNGQQIIWAGDRPCADVYFCRWRHLWQK